MCHTGHIHKGQGYPPAKPSLIAAKTFSLHLLSLSLILVTIRIDGDGSLPSPQALRTLAQRPLHFKSFWLCDLIGF